jgi:two-component system, OmpR family, heavy metal sensor histidine kinase CusS
MASRSLTLQLTLLFALASTAILVLLGAVLGVLVNEHFVMLDVEELDARARQVPLSGVAGGSVINATPEIRVPSGVAALVPRTVDGLGTTSPMQWTAGGRSFRAVAHRARVDTGRITVLAAIDISHHVAFMAMLWKVIGGSVAAGIASSVVLGWIAARRGTAPVREITRLAARVSAKRLDERLPTESLPPELVPLSRAFNEMLSRLEDSFRRLSDFSADLAHELRTPITNVMTQTQVVLSHARTAEEYREVLYSNLEEFQGLARVVEDMLFLAKSDNGLALPARTAVELGEEAAALAEFFEGLAAERAVRIECEGSAAATGDRLMVRRALANLISNAIRHSTPGRAVRIELSRDGAMASASVVNEGSDIPPEHQPRLFDRFYRVDRSRGRDDGGSGLGLTITRAIAMSHGGRVDVRSGGGSTRFTLLLPASPGDSAMTAL